MKIEPFKTMSEKCYDLEHLIRINNLKEWKIYVEVCKEEDEYPLRFISKNPTRWDNFCHVLEVIFKQYHLIMETLMRILMSEKSQKNASDLLQENAQLYAWKYISNYLLPYELISDWSYVLELIEKTNRLFSTSDRPVIHEVLIKYIQLRNDLINYLETQDHLTTYKLNTEFMTRENEISHVTASGNTVVDCYMLQFWQSGFEMLEVDDICDINSSYRKEFEEAFENQIEEEFVPTTIYKIKVQQTSVEYLDDFKQYPLSPVGNFIIQFIGLLDYRINKCFHDICYLIPLVLNPQLMGKIPGQNPYAFWALEQMLYEIPCKYIQGQNFDLFRDQQYYQSMPIPEFNWNNYPKIKELLKKEVIQVKNGYSVKQELNRLWTFQLPEVYKDIDILDFFKIFGETFPRICVVVRIFIVTFASESKVERMFSQSGLFLHDKRNKLSVDHLGQMTINKISKNESK